MATPIPYTPASPPDGLNRAVWEEFYRIAQALAETEARLNDLQKQIDDCCPP